MRLQQFLLSQAEGNGRKRCHQNKHQDNYGQGVDIPDKMKTFDPFLLTHILKMMRNA